MQQRGIIKIEMATFQHYEAVSLLREIVLPESHIYHYENNIGQVNILNLVAIQENSLLGFISVLTQTFNPSGSSLWERISPYIGFIGVMPKQQKQGIGRELIKAASISLGPKEPFLYLECDTELTPVYTRCGFNVVSPPECEKLFGMPSRAHLMRLKLQSVVS